MADARNVNHEVRERMGHDHALARRVFLRRSLALAECAAAGLVLEACRWTSPPTPMPSARPSVAATPSIAARPSIAATPSGAAEPAGGVLPGSVLSDVEAAALAEPFKGITTDGTPLTGLYSLTATGVSTEPIRVATEAFLETLNAEQRAATVFPVDDSEWRSWSDQDGYRRQGVSLAAMTLEQRSAATNMLAAALSAKGFETVQNVMKLNRTLGEIVREQERFNEYLYWVTVLGEPSATAPWGFQIDGNHLIVNYFILGDQVVMAPVFLGAEPPIAERGTYAGLRVLEDEQATGLALIRALTTEQRRVAIIRATKHASDVQAGAFSDNAIVPYAGIKSTALSDEQQVQLLDVINTWIGNLPDAHAARKRVEVRRHLADTYFAWVGDTGANAVFYYRIQSPVILIELDYQAPGSLADNADYFTYQPTRDHIHGVLRTPNGNDYGKALLMQYQAATSFGASGSGRPAPRP